MDYDKIDLKVEFKKMPDDVKEAIVSVEAIEVFNEISKKFLIPKEKLEVFAREIDLVLMNFVPKENFSDRLVAKVGLDKNTADELSESVNEKIFSKVKSLSSTKTDASTTEKSSWREPRETKVVGTEIHEKENFPSEPKINIGKNRIPSAPDPYRENLEYDESNLKKEDLLKTIENGGSREGDSTNKVPSKDFLKGNVEETPLEKKADILNDISLGVKREDVPDLDPIPVPIPAEKDLVEDKLKNPVSIQNEEKEIEVKSSDEKKSEGGYKGVVDPYRESFD